MCRNISLSLDMNILSSIEPRWSAGANTISAEGLYGFLLERLVGKKVVKVIGCEVRNGSAVCKFRLGSRRSMSVSTQHFHHFLGRDSYPTITALFSSSSSSNGVGAGTSGSGVHSSTSSSISLSWCQRPLFTRSGHPKSTYRLRQYNLFLGAVTRGQHISDGK